MDRGLSVVMGDSATDVQGLYNRGEKASTVGVGRLLYGFNMR